MSVTIKVPRAVNIRRLHATGLEPEDIVKLTGYSPAVVRGALQAGTNGVAVQK